VFLPATLGAADEPRPGGTLQLAIPYDPASIDPMTGRNLPDFDVLYACYDSLIDFEPQNLSLKPGLEKSWQWKNETTLVLHLNNGVEFHNGSPLDADAVKFNLERYRTDPRSNVKADLNAVRNIAVWRVCGTLSLRTPTPILAIKSIQP
jgi:glutathione transport system substrate-binding protein